MKYIHLLFFVIIGLNKIKCHVTDSAKYDSELLTTPPTNNKTKNVTSKEISVNTLEPPTQASVSKASENSMYLDEVLFSLKNQDWSSEEQPCLSRIYQWLYSLQNATLWAVNYWEAQAIEPQGILFGNRYQLGNFDQCMNAPWSRSHPELMTKYCLAAIVLERSDKVVRQRIETTYYPYQSAMDFIEHRPPHSRPINELTWGSCVPAACAPRTVERLIAVLLEHSYLRAAHVQVNISVTQPCQISGQDREYDTLFYAFCGVAVSLFAIALVCTYLNSLLKRSDSRTSSLVKSFCLKENLRELLGRKKGDIEVFYGIRFLTMCLIVMWHHIAMLSVAPISNGFKPEQDTQSTVGMLFAYASIVVNTYFFLSGLLTMAYLAKIKTLPNPLILILWRYIRLMPSFAAVIFFMCAVFPYTGSGPLWNGVAGIHTSLCRKNWFLNLLMISNYVDTKNMCMLQSWFIPCDFHFFVVTVLAYWLYMKQRHLGLTVAAILGVASILLPGIITYIYQLFAIQRFSYEVAINLRANKEFNMIYIKSHTRYASFLVGCISGYVLVSYSRNGNRNRIRQKWSVICTCTAITLMLAVMVLGGSFLQRDFHPLEGAVYAALNGPAWTCGVAVLVLCCTLGHVPLLKSFLSWYPWAPLSRLTYGLFLTHMIILTRSVFTTRNPQYFNYFEMMSASVGFIFLGCVAGLLLWLLVEAPFNKLLAICLTLMIKKTEINEESKPATLHTNNGEHLSDNIYISTKM